MSAVRIQQLELVLKEAAEAIEDEDYEVALTLIRAEIGERLAMHKGDSVPAIGAEEHLGDGLYASFDGFQIILRAPRLAGDDFVALEPSVYQALRVWVRRHGALARHMGEKR
jgi:hypothetical protein